MDQYGRYQIIQEIGRGSMGMVYKAYDPEIDRVLALKVLRPDRVTSKAFVDRFLKEAKAIGRLSHPNIVTVYDIGQDRGTVYIAMEFLEGRPLNDVIKQEKFDASKISEIGCQIASALDYAHKKGIIHRDIKPSNIIIDRNGNVKLTDFGIAHIEDPDMPHQTQAGEILGTPAYMSPEQVLGQPVKGSADIFSLGIILYEMAAGTRPFKGDNLSAIFNAITRNQPMQPDKLNNQVPKGLASVIMKCLAKEPQKRFHTAADLAHLLEAFKKGVGTSVHPGYGGKRLFVAVALFIVFLMLSIGGYLFYSGIFVDGNDKVAITSILDVTSIPPEARVFVDGDFKGLTPQVMKLRSGSHEIKISHQDYYPWEAQLNLKKDVTTPLRVELVPEQAGDGL